MVRLAVFVLMSAVMASVAMASVWYVDDSAVGGADDGSDWPNAFVHLSDAIAQAEAQGGTHEIRVAGGIYKPGPARTDTFRLLSGIVIRGGYVGLADVAHADRRMIIQHETRLSGDVLGDDLEGGGNLLDNNLNVVTGSGADETAVLDGVTIAAGFFDEPSDPPSGGGGMIVVSGSPTLIDCTFYGNRALFGGGLWVSGSSPRLERCRFTDNTAEYIGGGMVNDIGDPVLVECVFTGNLAGVHCGGLYHTEGQATLTDCAFVDNLKGALVTLGDMTMTGCAFVGNTGPYGGGVYSSGTSVILDDCTFEDNAAGLGGAMRNDWGSKPRLTNCTFINNRGNSGGGMYNSNNSNPMLIGCKFHANTADEEGGAISNESSSPILSNCVLTGNAANTEGGGMCSVFGGPLVVGCTFVGNHANVAGGALYNGNGIHTIVSSILWDNTSPDGPNIGEAYVTNLPITACCVEGGWVGFGNIDADPMLVDADGPDGLFGTEDDDVRLSPGSPCIDAGLTTALAPDLAGNRRVVDDPATPDTGLGFPVVMDIGAYEFGSTQVGTGTADIDGDGDVDLDDFAAFQRQFDGGNQ